MAGTLRLHGGTQILIEVGGEGAYLARGTSVPTDGLPGFAKGCIFIDMDAAAGSVLFCNEGTQTSCDFDAVSVA